AAFGRLGRARGARGPRHPLLWELQRSRRGWPFAAFRRQQRAGAGAPRPQACGPRAARGPTCRTDPWAGRGPSPAFRAAWVVEARCASTPLGVLGARRRHEPKSIARKEKEVQSKRWWLGGLATLAAFLFVAPAAFGGGYGDKFSKPSINVSDIVAQVQSQVASQDADVHQSGTAESGDATSQGGIAVGGDGGSGGDATALVDNSSNAAGGNSGTCNQGGDCNNNGNGGGSTASTSANSVGNGNTNATGGESGDAAAISAGGDAHSGSVLSRGNERGHPPTPGTST